MRVHNKLEPTQSFAGTATVQIVSVRNRGISHAKLGPNTYETLIQAVAYACHLCAPEKMVRRKLAAKSAQNWGKFARGLDSGPWYEMPPFECTMCVTWLFGS
jgi:hypothetical protein